METPEEIDKLSNERLEEARILFDNGKFDGAYYLSGYSIELALKAKICNLFGAPNLFVIKNERRLEPLIKVVKTHDLLVLLMFSGLKARFDLDKADNKSLSLGSSIFFQNWSEQLRYKPCGSLSKTECKELLELLTSEEGILKWIRSN